MRYKYSTSAVPFESPKLFQFIPHRFKGPIVSNRCLISELVAFLVKFRTNILIPLLRVLRPLCLRSSVLKVPRRREGARSFYLYNFVYLKNFWNDGRDDGGFCRFGFFAGVVGVFHVDVFFAGTLYFLWCGFFYFHLVFYMIYFIFFR